MDLPIGLLPHSARCKLCSICLSIYVSISLVTIIFPSNNFSGNDNVVGNLQVADEVFVLCDHLCRSRGDFAELLFPYLMYDLLLQDINTRTVKYSKILSHGIKTFLLSGTPLSFPPPFSTYIYYESH